MLLEPQMMKLLEWKTLLTNDYLRQIYFHMNWSPFHSVAVDMVVKTQKLVLLDLKMLEMYLSDLETRVYFPLMLD